MLKFFETLKTCYALKEMDSLPCQDILELYHRVLGIQALGHTLESMLGMLLRGGKFISHPDPSPPFSNRSPLDKVSDGFVFL
jgi:hypothetical protein